MNRNQNDPDPEYRKPFPGPNAQNQTIYKFSPEELRVLRECNKESFYKRCLPISAFLATSTYLGVKNGFLKPNLNFGATPKIVVSVIVGYFIGKFSYQQKCAEKLMQLPNSRLGEALRQRRRGTSQDTFDSGFGSGMSLSAFGNVPKSDMYSDFNPNNSLDLDTTRPENPGLDDYYRPSLDNPVFEEEEEMPPMQKYTTSYEELRKKNREEYQQKRMGNFKDFTNSSRPPTTPQYPTDSQSTDKDTLENPKAPRNKYGDIWG